MMLSLVSALVLSLSVLSATVVAQDSLCVPTELGFVRGSYVNATLSTGQVRAWYNVPYAASTAGANRWTKPKNRSLYAGGVFDATSSTPIVACPQNIVDSRLDQTEDCLILNVVAPLPSRIPSSGLPVMIWIHGGSLRNGASGAYDGTTLVGEQNIILVSINYRLGVLGFMGLNELKSETNGILGNYGFFDQLKAMEWVKANIANFGGNPSQVTIFGESAGALSVSVHLGSHQQTKHSGGRLFQRAIIESYYGPTAWSASVSDWLGNQFVFQTSCSGKKNATLVACLRSLDAATLLALPLSDQQASFGVTIDSDPNNFVTDTLVNLIKAGNWMRVPILLGTNHDEYALWLCGLVSNYQPALSIAVTEQVLSFSYPNSSVIAAALAEYPAANYPTPSQWHASIDLITDSAFACNTRSVADAAANLDAGNTAKNKVYVYQFAYTGGWSTACLQSSHFWGDVPMLFPREFYFDYPLSALTATDLLISTQVRTAWAQFASGSTASPSTTALPWPAYGASRTAVQISAPNTATPLPNFKGAQCAFWANEAPYVPANNGPNYFVRVNGVAGPLCSLSQLLFSNTVQNGTCSSATVSGVGTFYFIPSCANVDSHNSPWSLTLYSDAKCRTKLPVNALSAPSSELCGATDLSSLHQALTAFSGSVDCSNQGPSEGTATTYPASRPQCGTTTTTPTPSAAAPTYTPFLNGACLQISTNKFGSIQCHGSTSASSWTFRVYENASNCMGATPSEVFNGSGNSECVPYANTKFDCGSGGAVPSS